MADETATPPPGPSRSAAGERGAPGGGAGTPGAGEGGALGGGAGTPGAGERGAPGTLASDTPDTCATPERLTPRIHDTGPNTPVQGTPNISPASLDRNPEAPPELLQNRDLIGADTVGSTVFSKHWLFTTLMKLIKVVDSHNEGKERPEDAEGRTGDAEVGLDIDETLQDELCELWDMSMNSEVVAFLLEFKAVDILSGIIAQSKAPRATEISVGILGNMACYDAACQVISSSHKLIKLTLLLLADPDAPTLVEATRLIYTCLSNALERSNWLSVIAEDEDIYNNISFILKSSTNRDLLRNTGNLIDKLLDVDDVLCKAWSKPEFVQALLEAAKQVGPRPCDELATYIHIFQLMSTSQRGVEALLSSSRELSGVLVRYLMFACGEEIVGLEGRESNLASVFAVLTVLLSSVDCAHSLIIEDCQLTRCTLKVLGAVHPNLPHTPTRRAAALARGRAKSQTKDSPTCSTFHSEESAGIGSFAKTPERIEGAAGEDATLEGGATTAAGRNGGESGRKKRAENGKRRLMGDFEEEEKEVESVYDQEMLQTLHDIIQGLLRDVMAVIEKTESPLDASHEQSADDDLCSTLDYLDDACPRDRIYLLLEITQSEDEESAAPPTEGGTGDDDAQQGVKGGGRGLDLLTFLAERYELTRLKRVMRDFRPR